MSTCHLFFFFFNDTATTEIYTLSLHDALPILTTWRRRGHGRETVPEPGKTVPEQFRLARRSKKLDCLTWSVRSEEHTSELQSQSNLVCRLLLEKKKHDSYTYDHKLISLIIDDA